METTRLGRTNMMVSKLGFGGIPIQRISEDEAVAVVNRCLDLGITFVDTAHNYTNSQVRIGKAIQGRREEIILATKSQELTREGVEKQLKQSLEQLGVEYIDLYQFHNITEQDSLNKILAPNGPMTLVEEAKKAGLVRHIGVTSHYIDMAKELVKSDRFETIMIPLNVIAFEAADELLPLAREHDVGFIAMKPLAGGSRRWQVESTGRFTNEVGGKGGSIQRSPWMNRATTHRYLPERGQSGDNVGFRLCLPTRQASPKGNPCVRADRPSTTS